MFPSAGEIDWNNAVENGRKIHSQFRCYSGWERSIPFPFQFCTRTELLMNSSNRELQHRLFLSFHLSIRTCGPCFFRWQISKSTQNDKWMFWRKHLWVLCMVQTLLWNSEIHACDQRFAGWVLECLNMCGCQCVCGIFLHFAVSFQHCHHQSHRVVGPYAAWRQANIYHQIDLHALNYVGLTSIKRFVMCLLRYSKRTAQIHPHLTVHSGFTRTGVLILFSNILNTGCAYVLMRICILGLNHNAEKKLAWMWCATTTATQHKHVPTSTCIYIWRTQTQTYSHTRYSDTN